MTTAFEALAAEPWAIMAEWLPRLAAIAQRQHVDKAAAEAARLLREQEMAAASGPTARRLEGARYAMVTKEGVAVLPVFGPIFPRANMMTEMSGATSASALLNDYQLALANGEVGATMFVMDTPGGAVSGINALFDAIHAGQKKKPAMAYVSGLAASAGYWIASATGNIVMERTGIVGSIGIVSGIPKQVQPGANGYMTVEIVSTNAPNKRPDPTDEEGVSEIRRTLDAIEAQFIGDVAKGMGVTAAKVKSDFGQGGVKVGSEALSAGMAHGIKSHEAAFRELAGIIANKRRAEALRK